MKIDGIHSIGLLSRIKNHGLLRTLVQSLLIGTTLRAIAHNITMRKGSEKLANDMTLLGAFLGYACFLDGPKVGLEVAYKI